MTNLQHLWDIVVRSGKTLVEVYAAFLLAGGFNVIHVSGAVQLRVSALAAGACAILNLLIKIHNAVTGSTDTPVIVSSLNVPHP